MGSDALVALQKMLRQRGNAFAGNPLLSNGGRIMNILDPEQYGWDNVQAAAERDRLVGLTLVDRDTTLAKLTDLYGSDVEFPIGARSQASLTRSCPPQPTWSHSPRCPTAGGSRAIPHPMTPPSMRRNA